MVKTGVIMSKIEGINIDENKFIVRDLDEGKNLSIKRIALTDKQTNNIMYLIDVVSINQVGENDFLIVRKTDSGYRITRNKLENFVLNVIYEKKANQYLFISDEEIMFITHIIDNNDLIIDIYSIKENKDISSIRLIPGKYDKEYSDSIIKRCYETLSIDYDEEKLLEFQKEYLEYLRKLETENPEEARRLAIEALEDSSLDEDDYKLSRKKEEQKN
jgi:hypothetical protein